MDILNSIPILPTLMGVAFSAALIVAIFASLRWALVAFGIAFFASSVSYSVDPFTDTLIETLFTPIQLHRNFVYIFAGLLCYCAILAHAGKFNKSTINIIGGMLVAIAAYAGFGRIINGFTDVGLLSIGLALLTLVPLSLVAPNLLMTRDQIFAMLRIVLVSMCIWLGMNAVQYLVNPGVLYPSASGRFQGLTGNPQFASVLLAFSCVTCTWVAVNDPLKLVRLISVAAAALMGVCLLWTASRTGFGMAVLGMGIIFASRIGQLIIVLPFVAVFGFLAMQFLTGDGINIDTSRLVSTQNTRGFGWAALVRTFFEHPLFGTGNPNRSGASENSYLLSIAAFGIFMGFIVIALMTACALTALKLFTRRRYEDKQGKAFTDLVIAGFAMYFSGALLEGFIVARVHSATVYLLIFGTIGSRLLVTLPWHTRDDEAHDHASDEYDEWEDEPREHAHELEHEDDFGAQDWEEPQENVWDPAEDWDEYAPRSV